MRMQVGKEVGNVKIAACSAILVLTMLFGLAAPANSDWHEHSRIVALDRDVESSFGSCVSISGDFCLIGDPWNDEHGDYSGSAYIFRREGEHVIQQAKLTPSDADENKRFGYSVSVSGDYALIGARYDGERGSKSGAAYVFKREGEAWVQEAKLMPSDANLGDQCGISVCIRGDDAIIGASHGDGKDENCGSAYVFRREGEVWVEQAKLTASDGISGDLFGWSVSIDGDFCLAGAMLDDEYGEDSGSAYVFKREGSSWVQQVKLTCSDANDVIRFGCSVSIKGDQCLIGTWSRIAYVFKYDGTNWMEQAKLTGSYGSPSDLFGYSVCTSGSHCLVGLYSSRNQAGYAHVFGTDGETWVEEAVLVASDGSGGYPFASVSIDGDCCLVGASLDDSAYLYMRGGVPVDLEVSGPEELLVYSSGQFRATLRNDNGSWDDVTSVVSWSVEPETNASIDAKGLLTVNGSPGDIVIRAQYGDLEAEAMASVYTIKDAVFVPGQYETIQAAIDAVSDGNAVIVTPGTYRDEGNYNIDFHGKAITVRSLNGPESCIINCRHWSGRRGFIFSSGEGPDSVLSGFTITGGKLYGGIVKGAGIYCSGASPTIENCIVTDNWAYGQIDQHARGGGIYIESNGAPTIVNCTISENRVVGGDGSSDSMGYAASGRPGYGGGVCCYTDSSATIINCLVINNEVVAGDGGSSLIWGSDGGDAYGGGIYAGSDCHVTVQNCTITGNTVTPGVKGESMASGGEDGTAYGAGVCCHKNSIASIENSIIWGDSGADELSGGPTVIYSDVEGAYPGEGNINADPLFVVGPSGNYYLSQISAGQAVDSPCLDVGNETAANLAMCLLTTRSDEVGDEGMVDLGYHYWMPNPADLNRDGKVDMEDLAVMGLQWEKAPGVPPADCAPGGGDGVVDGLDLRLLSQNWLWCK